MKSLSDLYAYFVFVLVCDCILLTPIYSKPGDKQFDGTDEADGTKIYHTS